MVRRILDQDTFLVNFSPTKSKRQKLLRFISVSSSISSYSFVLRWNLREIIRSYQLSIDPFLVYFFPVSCQV